MNVDRKQLIAACRQYGPMVHVPAGIDGAQLLWALSGNESAFGANCAPRHEPGYCYISNGHYAPMVRPLTQKWGCLAHCSFGCWQVMLSNCAGFSPLELLAEIDAQAQAAVGFLNRDIFDTQHAQTLAEIGDAYNRGNFRDLAARANELGISLPSLESDPAEMAKMADAAYMTRLIKNYSISME